MYSTVHVEYRDATAAYVSPACWVGTVHTARPKYPLENISFKLVADTEQSVCRLRSVVTVTHLSSTLPTTPPLGRRRQKRGLVLIFTGRDVIEAAPRRSNDQPLLNSFWMRTRASAPLLGCSDALQGHGRTVITIRARSCHAPSPCWSGYSPERVGS